MPCDCSNSIRKHICEFWARPDFGSSMDRIEVLCKVSNSWEHADIQDGARICACASAFLNTQAEEFIRRRRHTPLAVWYCSDGTEHKHKHYEMARLGNFVAARRTSECADFLVQRWFCYDADGSRCCLVPPPLLLVNKTVWTHFRQQMEAFHFIRIQILSTTPPVLRVVSPSC